MMKKRNSLMFLVLLLVGCSQQPKEEVPVVPEVKEPEVSEPEVKEPEVSEPEDVEPEEAEPEEAEPEDVEPTPVTRTDYIRDTFLEYGYTTPSESEWIVKEEGPQKIAVIIKGGVGHGKSKICKLIFLEGDTNELILVQVEN